MSGMVLGSGKTAVSKRQPLPSVRSEQCVVNLTTAVVMIKTASIYSALKQQTPRGRLHGDERVGCHSSPQGAVAACLNNSLPAGG